MTKPTATSTARTPREPPGATVRRVLAGVAALIGLAALMIGMPLLLWAVRDVGTLHVEWTFAGLWRALLRPDDGTLFLAVVKLAGWITWAVLLASVVMELVGRIRHVGVPNVRGLGLPQGVARVLVAGVAALFLTTSGPKIPVATAELVPPPAPAAGAPAHAGQPSHARQPAYKQRSPRQYTVRKGDALSQIALDKLGNAHRYPEIFRASRSIHQPGGRRLTNPDVIDIGWKLNLPGKSKADRRDHSDVPQRSSSSTNATTGHRPQTDSTSRAETTTPSQSPTTVAPSTAAPTAAPAPTDTTGTQAPAPSLNQDVEASGFEPGWLLTGLAGAGGILAGSMWLALRRRRALQSHHRRHGFMIAPPPPVTIPVEKTLRHAGAPIAHLIGFIDDALRRTAHAILAAEETLPTVQALEVTGTQLVVHLTEPGRFPVPWQEGEDDTWQIGTTVDLDQIGPGSDGGPSPWPHLVTLGTDQAGRCWLVNLEAFGITTITGDLTFGADLARYWAAELATSPWAQDIWQIDLVGVFPELDGLHPAHMRVHTDADTADTSALRASQDILHSTAAESAPHLPAARLRQDYEYLPSCAVFAAAEAADALTAVVHLVQAEPGRTGTAVTFLGTPEPAKAGLSVIADASGRARIPAFGLDLFPVGITADEARGCVQLLKAADQLDNTGLPIAEGDTESIMDAAGRLHHDLTEQRRVEGCADAKASNLPEPDDAVLAVAATTPEDLAVLAPVIPSVTREAINHDPTLDDDLAAWHADSCDRPRLAVLGHVRVRVGRGGDPASGNKRKLYYTEIVAYLAIRPRGATTPELCDALATTPDALRRNLSVVRKWLGIDPATHEPFLPGATRIDPDGDRTYRLSNVLYDADLFRRLRLRGQTGGSEGLADYMAALKLVTGTPYTGLRANGGIWLTDSRDDQHLLVGIVDVAHLAVTMALAIGEFETAAQAARMATKVAPDEDRPRLDLAAVAAARGRSDESRSIGDAVLYQNDGDGPVELDDRTTDLLVTHGWYAPRAHAK